MNNKKKRLWVKLLWVWELKAKVNISLDKISKTAQSAIEKAWGTVKIIENIETTSSK